MDDVLIALALAVVVAGAALAHSRSGRCAKRPLPRPKAPPPPIAEDESAMGVHGEILHALQSTVEPIFADDPECLARPEVEDIPEVAEVEEVVRQVCWNASKNGLEFHPGVVIRRLVKRDDIGRETFIITTFVFERKHITSLRITIKAERRAKNGSLHIRAIAYDPVRQDTADAPHTGPGEITSTPGKVDTSIYTI